MSGRLYTVEKRLYQDKDGNIVPSGDPNAAVLFAVPGARIPIAEAKRLGLIEEPKVKSPSKSKKAPTAKNKQAKAPENKGSEATETKGE